jgi:hypothetical protein
MGSPPKLLRLYWSRPDIPVIRPLNIIAREFQSVQVEIAVNESMPAGSRKKIAHALLLTIVRTAAIRLT